MKLQLSLFIACFFISSAVIAQNSPSDSSNSPPLTDWFALSAALQSKGIDVTYVNWITIEPMCLPLKTGDSDINYNKCRYDKAILQHLFQTDSTACKQQSIAKFPDSWKVTPPTVNTTIIGSDGRAKLISTTQPFTAADISNDRNSFYIDCMLKNG